MPRPSSWLRVQGATSARGWWWVLVGLAAVGLILAGQLADTHGLLERHASWWRPFVTLPGHAVLLLAWWQLGPGWRRPLTTAALWSLPLLFTLPLHSRDAYAYAATGWQVAHGLDPYVTALGDAGQAGLLVGLHWYETTSVYPALSLELFGLISRLTGGDLYWTLVALRLPSVLALVILAFVLPRLARHFGVDPAVALWAGVLNPIMLIQLIGGVHNDALMVALGAAAMLAVLDLGWSGWRGLVTSGVLLGLAMGLKQSAALFGLGVVALGWAARHPAWKGWGRLAVTAVLPGAVTVATFLLTSASRGLGWRNPTAGNPIEATSNAPFSWVASFLRYNEVFSFPVANALVGAVSTVCIALAVVLLWVRFGPRGDSVGAPWRFTLAVLTAACALAPALQPWYLTWLLPLYAFAGLPARWHRVWLVCVLAFSLLPALQDKIAPYWAMFVVAVPAVVLWRAMTASDCSPLPESDGDRLPRGTLV